MNSHKENLLPPAVANWIDQWIASQKISKDAFFVTPLTGDGSQRSFYRVEWQQSSRTERRVLLFDPDWKMSGHYPAHQTFLQSKGIPVPQFHLVKPDMGCLLMEDLGDELLQSTLLDRPSGRLEWLKRATRLLAELHRETYPVPATLPAAQLRFDQKKFAQELRFTQTHISTLVGEYPPGELSESSLETFCAELASITPFVFCHRDYHSRNIIVHQDTLYLIDFQDARLGPAQYDLASLLFDAYFPIVASERDQLTALYQTSLEGSDLAKEIDWSTFKKGLLQVGFQRTLKALGSFASFFNRYQKAQHLCYMLPALHSAIEISQTPSLLSPETLSLFPLNRWSKKLKTLELNNWNQ